MSANGNSPHIYEWGLTDDELTPIRRIDPHVGPPLWMVINPFQYIPARVRAWGWTDGSPDKNGRLGVHFGPLALWQGKWMTATGGEDGLEVFDSIDEAHSFIKNSLT